MKITVNKISKVDPKDYNSDDPIFYWVSVDFFKEIGGRGISATVSIDIDYEEDLKLIDVEQNAIKKAKDFLANAVSTF